MAREAERDTTRSAVRGTSRDAARGLASGMARGTARETARGAARDSAHGSTGRVAALDGLRALCALAVVGYHMGLKWLSGGFLGVVVFFVLSGYLATDGILKAYARNRGEFSLLDYYLRRIRRLLPQAAVCVVVVAALCAVGNRILLTKMRPDVIPALLGYLNWAKIFSNVSYFEAAGSPSPLLHFWSLAIEWQFFLVWPPVLLLLMRLRTPKRGVRIGLVVLALASAMALAVLYATGDDSSRAYFGTDTRALSLLAGCWLAFALPIGDERTRGLAAGERQLAVEGAGVAAILAMAVIMVLATGYSSFSYYGGIALVTVLAVVAVGALLAEGTLVSRALGLPPLAWLGQRSYALYLWHYPIILLLTDRSSTTGTPVWMRLVQLALSLAAAELTYRFVERPCGERGAIVGAVRRFAADVRERGAAEAARARAVFLVPGALVCVVALVGLLVLPPVQVMAEASEEQRVGTTAGSEEATVQPQVTYDVVLVGDSVPLDAYDDLIALLPNALVDCRVSRQMAEGIQVLREYEQQGSVGHDVVVCLGSNGVLTSSELYELLGVVGGGRRLLLVNNRMPDEWQDANNELLARFAEAQPTVELVDWFAASTGHDDWFWEDGEHVTPEGAAAYARLVADALGVQATAGEATAGEATAGEVSA